jgi:predicted RNA-binding protein with PUA-like domain
MSWWLIKSEPDVYPFTRLLKDKHTAWEGVRNYEARNNLRAMKQGDLALFYHSNIGKAVVGVARVKREAYRDPTARKDEAGKKWAAVDVEPVRALATPVSLAAIKGNKKLAKMALIKKSRISVVPVTKDEFEEVLKMGGAS